MVKVSKLKEKSIQVLKSFGFLIALEGAVRSGKTVISLVKWYYYVIKSPEKVFLMSGYTMGSLARNCLIGDFGFLAITGNKAIKKRDAEGNKYLALGDKMIYYCGGGKSDSADWLRGITFAGWYADEVNLHHKDFVAMAMSRSFTSTDRLNLWTLNPSVPTHFIYTDYLDKYKKEETPGYVYFHFLMQDNPAITEERMVEICAQYSGVFYKRYVLGLRVRAEGGCYPSYDPDIHVINKVPDGAKLLYVNIGVDIGGSTSATTFTADGFFLYKGKLILIVLDEFYDIENKKTETVIFNYVNFVLKIKGQYHNVVDCFVDSAEQLFKKSFADKGMVNVRNAVKGLIVERIRFLDLQFSREKAFILKRCKKTIEAVESAVWDQKAEGETRLDDGIQNVDSLDSMEYGFEKAMRDFR
jgi:PBSX family phage terminase large subunit